MHWYRKLIVDITVPNPYSPTYSITTFSEGSNADPEP